MFTVIGIMLSGILAGYLLRSRKEMRFTGRLISYTIFLLLFLLGISVGNNEAIVNNLPEIGGKAFLIAVSATLGSLICAWVVYRYFFKKEGESSKHSSKQSKVLPKPKPSTQYLVSSRLHCWQPIK